MLIIAGLFILLIYVIMNSPNSCGCGPTNMNLKCMKCGFQLEEDYNYCPSCREQLKKKCENCGKMIDVLWRNCPYCE